VSQRSARALLLDASALLIVMVVKLLLKSLRVRFEGDELKGGGVVTFLHGEQLPLLLHIPDGPVVAPISLSSDGDLQTRVMSCFGVEVIRGSSSRGGLRVLRGLSRELSTRPELFALIAVDGPRGPYAVPQPGALYLSTRLNRPLWLCRVHCQQAWRLKSWDRFLIPKPFSKVLIHTRALSSSSAQSASEYQGAQDVLSRALSELHREEAH